MRCKLVVDFHGVELVAQLKHHLITGLTTEDFHTLYFFVAANVLKIPISENPHLFGNLYHDITPKYVFNLIS